jgi:cytidine deaminase
VGPRLSREDERRLCRAAKKAQRRAYAPYSRFLVGAALLVERGEIVAGCNVENASYGLSLCAERCAIGTAIAAGYRRFFAIAIATSSPSPSPPCGMCRQVLSEHAPDLPLLLVGRDREERFSLVDLFPHSFDRDQLRSGQAAQQARRV